MGWYPASMSCKHSFLFPFFIQKFFWRSIFRFFLLLLWLASPIWRGKGELIAAPGCDCVYRVLHYRVVQQRVRSSISLLIKFFGWVVCRAGIGHVCLLNFLRPDNDDGCDDSSSEDMSSVPGVESFGGFTTHTLQSSGLWEFCFRTVPFFPQSECFCSILNTLVVCSRAIDFLLPFQLP